ncbi:hypothetical protein CFC21_089153 [Triticum aestivum]|uniref:Uncharacterized protein n=2 Tax=Triticum aestivum TaxID=4565 RepID=A0A3B6PQ44_WHEAT|nr:hypothetical protein CFC21_089153 [Triticum aestivum]
MEKVAVAAAKTAHPPPPSPGKPTTLLDVHEVEWITRELERLLVRETVGAGADARRRRKRAEAKAASPEAHAKKGGFLAELLGKHAASICGDGAVSGAVLSARRGRGRSGFREVDKV